MSTSVKRQVPLTAAQAWERLQNTLSQTQEGRKAKTQIDDVARLLVETSPQGKRKRYQEFLLEVLRRCGLSFVVLCAIGLGQAQIAMMNTTARSTLLGILEGNLNNPHLPRFREMAPDKLAGIQVHHPRPPERSRNQYWLYKLCTADVDTFSTYFSPRIRYFMEESCLRAWEMRRSIIGTEVVRTDVPMVVFEDCLMFLEVGLVQDLISELFPADKRIITPLCCPDHYSLTGALVEAIFPFFGPYLSRAIDESKLRQWEKEDRQLEITDCVEVRLRDSTSHHGILKLRIGWSVVYELVNSLYV